MSVDVLQWEGLLSGEEVAHLAVEPPRDATFAPLPEGLAAQVGVDRLYAHQRTAWDVAATGGHLLIATGTASGKTLAFNLPVLDAIARDPKTRALYLYPTKALAQDQFRALASYALPGLRPAIYDGDTPIEQRREIRRGANVVLTNPDMVHIGVLPNHDKWGDLLANLRYVVIDEAHVYRGVFGSHVANVLRRLRRLARAYGSEPQFLLASATVANPGELGIDIGLLDAVISVGFPGTVASLRQQWGRAGRRDSGVAVLVATEDALDQYFMRNPDALLGRRVEAAILDHANPRVLAGHLRSAAYEAPLTPADEGLLGPLAAARADPLLRESPAGIVWAGRDHPAAHVSLRSAEGDAFTVIDASTGAMLGVVDGARAYSTVHQGAVYLHLGESYLVRELYRTALHAIVEPFKGDWYTQAKKETSTTIVEAYRVEQRLGLELTFGEIEVTEQVVAYERKTVSGQERIELVQLELPETSFSTEAIWFLPEAQHLAELSEMPKLLGTLHAAEHALIAMLPLWAMCDRWDIGGLSTNIHPQTGRPTVFVYDGHPGGVGITQRGFEQFEGWVADTAALLRGCPCADGCPSCVQSPKCGNLNDMLDKAGALTFLERLSIFAGPVRRTDDNAQGGRR